MKPTTRLGLWLLLAADGMFFVGLLGASRVVVHGVSGRSFRFDGLAVVALTVGRIAVRRKWIAMAMALIAGMLMFTTFSTASSIEQLLHGVVIVHSIALIPVTFALNAELPLLWEFVIALGLISLAASK